MLETRQPAEGTERDKFSGAIARHLRLEREARSWSLAELALHAGVGKATISKIERGEVSPTAVILGRLAAAFGVSLARFLLKAETEDRRLFRHAEQPVWEDPETGYRRRQVFAKADHPLDLATIEFPPGREVSFPAAAMGSRHLIWVMKGKLVVVEGTEAFELSAGDCLSPQALVDIIFRNDTNEICLYAVALIR